MSHLTAASSENAVKQLFAGIRDNFKVSNSNSADFGIFTAGYEVEFHLEGGSIDLRDDNSLELSELDIKWDKLRAYFGIDLDPICIGGWCIIPIPFDGCLVRLPEICLFEDDPDFGIDLDLGGLLTSEISLAAKPKVGYFIDPARTPGMSWLDAEDAGIPNKWQFFINPVWVDIDIFDFADIVGDLLDDAIEKVVDDLLFFLPDWAKDVIKVILGSLVDVIRGILDIGDDIDEWLSDLLGVSLGLFDFVTTIVADYFASKTPLLEVEDPFPILPASSGLIPVKLPIEDFDVKITNDEIVITADVGGV